MWAETGDFRDSAPGMSMDHTQLSFGTARSRNRDRKGEYERRLSGRDLVANKFIFEIVPFDNVVKLSHTVNANCKHSLQHFKNFTS